MQARIRPINNVNFQKKISSIFQRRNDYYLPVTRSSNYYIISIYDEQFITRTTAKIVRSTPDGVQVPSVDVSLDASAPQPPAPLLPLKTRPVALDVNPFYLEQLRTPPAQLDAFNARKARDVARDVGHIVLSDALVVSQAGAFPREQRVLRDADSVRPDAGVCSGHMFHSALFRLIRRAAPCLR